MLGAAQIDQIATDGRGHAVIDEMQRFVQLRGAVTSEQPGHELMLLEHHLVEGSLEGVGDIGSFNFLGGPLGVLSECGTELITVQPQCVAKILGRRTVGTMEIHGLNFEDPIPTETKRVVFVADNLDHRRIERRLRRAVGWTDIDLSAEFDLEVTKIGIPTRLPVPV